MIGRPGCAHLTARHRGWERWRRVAPGSIVVARHLALYGIGCVQLHLVGSPMTRGNGPPARRRVTAAEHAHAAIEELGLTAINLGQMLSTRDDALPPDWQHSAPRSSKSSAVRHTRCSTRSSIAPLACASIGQAHAAKLTGGTDVVVNVRRPGVVDEVELDLERLGISRETTRHLRSRSRSRRTDGHGSLETARRAQPRSRPRLGPRRGTTASTPLPAESCTCSPRRSGCAKGSRRTWTRSSA